MTEQTEKRRSCYASRHPSTDELTLATFHGVKLASMSRAEAIRLIEDIVELFELRPASVPTAPEKNPTQLALRKMLLARGWKDVGAGCLQHPDDGNVSSNELGCVELALIRAGYLTSAEREVASVPTEEPRQIERIAAFCEQVAADGALPSRAWFAETASSLRAMPAPEAAKPHVNRVKPRAVTYERDEVFCDYCDQPVAEIRCEKCAAALPEARPSPQQEK